MPGEEQGTFSDGTPFTVGSCDQPQYRGKKYVSIGDRWNHTTFIVDPSNAEIYAIKSRGSDKQAWRSIAIAVLNQ